MKKLLSKFFVFALLITSSFTLAACMSNENNIQSIQIVAETVPEYIKVNEFDEAGIQALITYENSDKETIDVTSSMIPDDYKSYLSTPGVYKIEIIFKNVKTDLTIKIVESTNVYTVKFFNSEGNIISTQSILHGEDAVAPSVDNTNIDGFEFVAWDRAYTNITADANIYAISVNVESILTNEEILNRLENAVINTKKLSHQASVMYKDTSIVDEKENSKVFIDYEYTNDEQIDVSIKGLNYLNNEFYWANIANKQLTEKLAYSEPIDGGTIIVNYDNITDVIIEQGQEPDFLYYTESNMSFDRIAELSYLLPVDELENLITNLKSINYNIKLTANTYYYTIELEIEEETVYTKYVFEFNDDRMLNVQRLSRNKNSEINFLTIEKIYDYSNVNVEDFEIVVE